MRLDRLLYFLRFAKSRSLAQRWIAEGHMRSNGARVREMDHAVHVGDVLTLPLGRGALAIELLTLPERRGPAPEAKACYRLLDGSPPMDLAGAHARQAEGKTQQ